MAGETLASAGSNPAAGNRARVLVRDVKLARANLRDFVEGVAIETST
jgi:hypothetical protein